MPIKSVHKLPDPKTNPFRNCVEDHGDGRIYIGTRDEVGNKETRNGNCFFIILVTPERIEIEANRDYKLPDLFMELDYSYDKATRDDETGNIVITKKIGGAVSPTTLLYDFQKTNGPDKRPLITEDQAKEIGKLLGQRLQELSPGGVAVTERPTGKKAK